MPSDIAVVWIAPSVKHGVIQLRVSMKKENPAAIVVYKSIGFPFFNLISYSRKPHTFCIRLLILIHIQNKLIAGNVGFEEFEGRRILLCLKEEALFLIEEILVFCVIRC